jgi:phosphohistidine swiveling domain-containing protein
VGIEQTLVRLEKLLSQWGIKPQDWILVTEYALRLLGYDVKIRKGHLNIIVNRKKLPWDPGEALETHPPEKTKLANQLQEFVEGTGLEFDILPPSPQDFRKKLKNSVVYSLPNGKQINIQTPQGALEELASLLSKCTAEGWGEEKGIRVLPFVEDQREVFLRKGEYQLAKLYGELLQKYAHLKKTKVPSRVKQSQKVEIISGIPASKGKIKGRTRLILDLSGTEEFLEGEILVTTMTSPRFTSFIKKAAALVTDEGGVLCHAAIAAREIKKPCVVGTKIATQVLKNGNLIEVDASKGLVRKLSG